MRIANRVSLEANVKATGIVCAAAACALMTMPVFAQSSSAQDDHSGVSRPSSAVITADEDSSVPVVSQTRSTAKPSAAIPATPATSSSQVVYGPYVPYGAAGAQSAAATTTTAKAFDPDANIVTEETAGRAQRQLLSTPVTGTTKDDVDQGIVTHVPLVPGEVSGGTLMKVRLREELSTLTTRPGTKFSADVIEPMMRDGVVIVPVGSLMEGRVTQVRGGKRIGGAAAIHLDARTVTLPDGSQYVLRARVIDTDRWDITKVDEEGTILRRDMSKGSVAAMSLTTGGAMAAGAVIGGLPGAVIGAGVGAGVSTVVWLRQDRQAELHKNLGIVFSLTEPMSITPARAAVAPVTTVGAGGE